MLFATMHVINKVWKYQGIIRASSSHFLSEFRIDMHFLEEQNQMKTKLQQKQK
jgi:ethanolamine utilization cobalamin adenosyltransferase